VPSGYIPKKLQIARRAHQIVALGADCPPDKLRDDHEMAEWWGLSPQWFRFARIGGYGPPFIELGPRLIRYRHDVCVAWLRALPLLTSTAESPHRGKTWNSPYRRQGNGAAKPNRFTGPTPRFGFRRRAP